MNEINQKLNKIIDEALEPMNEMSMAWYSQTHKRCCWVENPSGYNNKYFKYYNGAIYGKADRCARISMIEPKYEQHRPYKGKQNWTLTEKEKRELCQLMEEHNKKYNCTNWQATLITYNEDNFGIDYEATLNSTFSKEEFPEAFDINTPMPDYTKLKANK